MESRQVAAAALRVAITEDRESEREGRKAFLGEGIRCAAVNFGGEYITSVNKAIEHAVVAARRESVIGETHAEEGAVAGAVHEALGQIMTKAMGLNVGGKIAVARGADHVSAAVFFGIGLLHLNEISVGLGHRVI